MRCYNCGNSNTKLKEITGYYKEPYGTRVPYKYKVHYCNRCKEGIFDDKQSTLHDINILIAYTASRRVATKNMLSYIKKNKKIYGVYSSIERCLSLKLGTLDEWSTRDLTEPEYALLSIVRSCPDATRYMMEIWHSTQYKTKCKYKLTLVENKELDS